MTPCSECDSSVLPVSPQAVQAAYKLIKDVVVRTPCEYSRSFSSLLGYDVHFKNESKQVTRSYKERGVVNTLMKLEQWQKQTGVVGASSGNYALALCHHAVRLGIPVTVCMPTSSSKTKYDACVKTGANVVLHGDSFGEAKGHAERMVVEKNLTYINGYDHPDIIAGQGSVAVEVLEQVPNVDTIVAPIGGGGLIAGIALHVKSVNPKIKIIGVQTDICNGMVVSLKNKKPTPCQINIADTIADGLSVSLSGQNSYEIISRLVDDVVQISEDWVSYGVVKLIELERCVVEGAGAASVASAFSNPLRDSKCVVFILSGSNIDMETLHRVIGRGLVAAGRVVQFLVKIPSKGPALTDVMRIVTECKAEIKDIASTTDVTSGEVLKTRVQFTIALSKFADFAPIHKKLEEMLVSVKLLTKPICAETLLT